MQFSTILAFLPAITVLAAPTESYGLQRRTDVIKTAKAGLNGLLADGLPAGRRDVEIHRRKPQAETTDISDLSEEERDALVNVLNALPFGKRDVEIHRRKPQLKIPEISDEKLKELVPNGVHLRKRDVA